MTIEHKFFFFLNAPFDSTFLFYKLYVAFNPIIIPFLIIKKN